KPVEAHTEALGGEAINRKFRPAEPEKSTSGSGWHSIHQMGREATKEKGRPEGRPESREMKRTQAASASSAARRRSLSSRDSATEVRTPLLTNSTSPFTTRSFGSIPAQLSTSRPSRERAQRAICSAPLPY